MVSSLELALLTGGGFLILGVVLCLIYLKRRSAQIGTLQDVQRQFEGVSVRAVNPSAYFCGMERSWDAQWLGYGVLMLTDEMLYFRSWRTRLDLSVPLVRVEEVGIESKCGVRVRRRKPLQVVYRGVDNEVRVATWLVRRPQKWVRELREMIERSAALGTAEEKHLSQDEDLGRSGEAMGR